MYRLCTKVHRLRLLRSVKRSHWLPQRFPNALVWFVALLTLFWLQSSIRWCIVQCMCQWLSGVVAAWCVLPIKRCWCLIAWYSPLQRMMTSVYKTVTQTFNGPSTQGRFLLFGCCSVRLLLCLIAWLAAHMLDQFLGAMAVGGFVFLRFICPAIVSPDVHNLVKKAGINPHCRTRLCGCDWPNN
jgi:glucan phosphoethanolaminetransferase (alkaline phosphatase superfamily)